MMACSKSLRLLERLPRRGGLEQLLAAARRPTGGLSKSRSTQLANKKSLAGSIQVGGLLRIHCAANGCAAAQFHVRREWARFGAAVQRCFGVFTPGPASAEASERRWFWWVQQPGNAAFGEEIPLLSAASPLSAGNSIVSLKLECSWPDRILQRSCSVHPTSLKGNQRVHFFVSDSNLKLDIRRLGTRSTYIFTHSPFHLDTYFGLSCQSAGSWLEETGS
jgi:hypothetical protein